jgi:hypothetical protein
MTLGDTAKLIAYITTFFPRHWDGVAGGEETIVRAWHDLLQDIPAGSALAAVRAHIETNRFPPTISEIRKQVLTPPTAINTAEMWREVQDAVRKFGQYQEDAAMVVLSPLAATAARLFGWRELCIAPDGDGVARAQFSRMLEAQKTKEEFRALVDPKVLQMIEGIGGQKQLPEGEK